MLVGSKQVGVCRVGRAGVLSYSIVGAFKSSICLFYREVEKEAIIFCFKYLIEVLDASSVVWWLVTQTRCSFCVHRLEQTLNICGVQ